MCNGKIKTKKKKTLKNYNNRNIIGIYYRHGHSALCWFLIIYNIIFVRCGCRGGVIFKIYYRYTYMCFSRYLLLSNGCLQFNLNAKPRPFFCFVYRSGGFSCYKNRRYIL